MEELQTILDDGTAILFRPIDKGDKGRLRRGFEQLSPESRYRRFFRNFDTLSDKDLQYLTEIDYRDHFAWIALLRDDPEQPAVGVGRWIRMKAMPQAAEAAVTVADYLHNRGLGKTLLWLCAKSAVERDVHEFRVWVLGENKPILQLLREFGAQPGQWESGVLELTVPLPDDIEKLEMTPAPLILRAVAEGLLVGQAEPRRTIGTRLDPGAAEGDEPDSRMRPRPDLNRRPSP